MASYRIVQQPEWQWWVTPKGMELQPIHRWYIFPHSFTNNLVHALINEWELKPTDQVLDSFAGAGTTLLACKEKRIPATGYDLSPLAVFASQTKIANYSLRRLETAWAALQPTIDRDHWENVSRPYPELVVKALPGRLLGAFDALATRIGALSCSAKERDFFHLALLKTLPIYSRATASGGWLEWVKKHTNARSLFPTFTACVESMLLDLQGVNLPRKNLWHANLADVRALPAADCSYSAVITSPPYPNRHDYTRVFGVELMFDFLDSEETRQLRYQSFHSHPEARPQRPDANNYTIPRRLIIALNKLEGTDIDRRVPAMLRGYFLDMFISLRELHRVCRPNARIALVVGNAQYMGIPIPVDLLTAEIGEQVGLTCEKIVATRYRGNSAQQMEVYGRNPSRESVVFLKKPM